jgi:hypothetical protein
MRDNLRLIKISVQSATIMSMPAAPPHPDLRIVPTHTLRAHEEHDSQRSQPLIHRLHTETHMINPPIVTQVDDTYVILDGANRTFAFSELGYPHILVQVVEYGKNSVELDTWNHVIGEWTAQQFLDHLTSLHHTNIEPSADPNAIVNIVLRDGRIYSLKTDTPSRRAHHATLCQFVHTYQRNAPLHRTTITESEIIWGQYPNAIALVKFTPLQPDDILFAAREHAYIPPGISRHIVHGRAIRVNYPLGTLLDDTLSLDAKNEALHEWLRDKLANRQVRFYAEATYQFDE